MMKTWKTLSSSKSYGLFWTCLHIWLFNSRMGPKIQTLADLGLWPHTLFLENWQRKIFVPKFWTQNLYLKSFNRLLSTVSTLCWLLHIESQRNMMTWWCFLYWCPCPTSYPQLPKFICIWLILSLMLPSTVDRVGFCFLIEHLDPHTEQGLVTGKWGLVTFAKMVNYN